MARIVGSAVIDDPVHSASYVRTVAGSAEERSGRGAVGDDACVLDHHVAHFGAWQVAVGSALSRAEGVEVIAAGVCSVDMGHGGEVARVAHRIEALLEKVPRPLRRQG